jgi:hypothetical protein
MPGLDIWHHDWLIWEQGKGYREPTEAERAAAARDERKLFERLEKLCEEVSRAMITGGRTEERIRRAIAILRLDPPLEWEDGCEQMDFYEWVAGALERAYFPTPARTRARRLHWKKLQRKGYRNLIDTLAKREGISKAKALEKLAGEFKKTPEALDRFLRRDPEVKQARSRGRPRLAPPAKK